MKSTGRNIFYVAVLLLLFVAACKFGASGENTGSSGSPGGSGEIAADTDPKEVIAASMKNLQAAESWVAEVNTSNDAAPQADAKIDVEYFAPDRFHIENESAGNKFEVILIGADAYLLANGKWQKAPAGSNMGQMINNWKEIYNAKSLAALKNIQFAGKETINGKDLLAYSYEIDPLAAMPDDAKAQMTDAAKAQIAQMNSRAKIWIEPQRNLPARLEMTTRMTKPKEMTTKIAFDYKFDREVKIEAPKLP